MGNQGHRSLCRVSQNAVPPPIFKEVNIICKSIENLNSVRPKWTRLKDNRRGKPKPNRATLNLLGGGETPT